MPKIIAECCQNHNGDLNILKDMIWAAAEAGADYVKIQSMLSDNLTFRERFEKGLVENSVTKIMNRPYKTEYERLKQLDLDDQSHYWFIEECRKTKIKPLTTVFSNGRIPFLASLDWNEIKLASYDCGSIEMIERLKMHFKHLYLSTGASYDEEIIQTAEILDKFSYTFLHCVTIYPTPLNQVHLARMNWLSKFTNSVGFSDHSLVARDGLKASFAAIYYGADVIERHFTVLASDKTKDGPVSINPVQLKELVSFAALDKEQQKQYVLENIPEFQIMIGIPNRPLSKEELLNRDYYRGRFATKKDSKIVYNWEKI